MTLTHVCNIWGESGGGRGDLLEHSYVFPRPFIFCLAAICTLLPVTVSKEFGHVWRENMTVLETRRRVAALVTYPRFVNSTPFQEFQNPSRFRIY